MERNKCNRPISTPGADNLREYINSQVHEYLQKNGICFEAIAPYAPEQNGRSEWDNRTIAESTLTMLEAKICHGSCGLKPWTRPSMFCTEHNHCMGLMARHMRHSIRKPDISYLRALRSEAYCHIPKIHQGKFHPKAKKTIVIGYNGNYKSKLPFL